MKHSVNIRCPVCQGPLEARILECASCGVRVEGAFARSEFDRLDEEELHFLRMFVHCEGRIRELEKALGVSYPTVKARLGDLKKKLGLDGTIPEFDASSVTRDVTTVEVLEALDQGDISAEEALRELKS